MPRPTKSTMRWQLPRRPGNSETWLADDARELRAVQSWRSAYQSGMFRRIETYLEQHPEIADDVQLALRLIYEEACLREEAGETVTLAEYKERFPQWTEQLGMLWECHDLLAHHAHELPVFPRVGETVGDFRLVSEIDRGAAGRVFLATQPSLLDRPVVIKVTAHDGQEHLSLARLQHASIVPLYFVQYERERRLRMLCMPYLGGTSLARLLGHLEKKHPRRRKGSDLCRVLDELKPADVESGEDRGPARKLYARSSYLDAVCWIGACLADALHHAHARQLVHLDVKPSNVLIAGDGQPMLLDFHLAQPMLPAFELANAPMGGTPGYMSPEQAAAMEAVRAGQPLRQSVDARSDIYSLGAVLYECLTGSCWDEAMGEVPQLRARNPEVTTGIEDVIRRCLDRDPDRRYDSAGALAEDLRRHVLHLPLQGVANRSSWERLTKWRRRRPYAVWSAVSALALGITLITAAFALSGRVSAARQALKQGRSMLAERKYESAANSLQLGLDLICYVPVTGELRGELKRELRTARSIRLLDSLHEAVDQLRFLDGLTPPNNARMADVSEYCANAWEQRQHFAVAERDVQQLEVSMDFSRDMTDLAVLWSDVRVRLAPPPEKDAARQAAREVLDQAEQLLGPRTTLARERYRYHQGADGVDPDELAAEHAPGKDAWDQFTFGRFLMRSGEYERAWPYLEKAVRLEPGSFWFHFYAGTCSFRLRQYDNAVTAFSVCIALAPNRPECFDCRALAYQALGERKAADRDVAMAQQLRNDAKLTAASR